MEITTHHGLLKDTHVHVDDHGGDGRPVVLIHGWPLSGQSWAAQVPALQAAGYRVITYDRRGFGASDKPKLGYDYDTLTDDLHAVLTGLDLEDVTLVGFSMGGGEVARYFTKYGHERVHSVVFASAVTPYLMQGADNPDGPLDEATAADFAGQLTADQESFYDGFTTLFFSVGDVLKVTESQRQDALAMCRQADKLASLQAMTAWATTDFREDLTRVDVPVLVLHGDGDGPVPFEGSGQRTHAAIPGSELHVIAGAPHGANVSHAEEFNRVLIEFLAK
jgi:pimeloyl-ACP methyl ester carboxylesterase